MADEQQPQAEPELPPEAQAAIQEMIQQVAGMLSAFAGHLSSEQLLQLGAEAMRVQAQLGPVIADATEPQARETNPFWGVKITNKSTGEAIRVKTFKDIARAKEMGEFVDFVVTLGLVLTPVLRGVLAAHGYGVEFFQSPETIIAKPN